MDAADLAAAPAWLLSSPHSLSACWHQIVKSIFIPRTAPSPGPQTYDTALASWKSGRSYSKLILPHPPSTIPPHPKPCPQARLASPNQKSYSSFVCYIHFSLSQDPNATNSLWVFLVKFSLTSVQWILFDLLWPLKTVVPPPFLPTIIFIYVSIIHISTHTERSSSHNIASFLHLFSLHPTLSNSPFNFQSFVLCLLHRVIWGADLDQFAWFFSCDLVAL